MSYEVTTDKVSILVDNVEAGYVKYNKTHEGMEIIQTYVFPGFRENGYAQNLVKYMVGNHDHEISKVHCSYYRIMSKDYKLSLI